MRKNRLLLKIYIILLMILIITVLSSCKKQEKPKPTESKEKIPQALSTLDEKNDKIIEDIEKAQEEKKKEEPPKMENKKQEDQNSQEQQSEEKKGEEKDQKKQEQDKEQDKEKAQTKEEKIKKFYDDAKKTVEEMNSGWNNYEIEIINKGISNKDVEVFEDTLNMLTVVVYDKKDMEILMEANRLTLYMSDFFNLYKGNMDGEILKMKYLIRQTYLLGQMEEWVKAEETIGKTDDILNRMRQKMKIDKESQKKVEKFNLSLQDIKSAIKKENVDLLKIKRDIGLKNLENLKGM